MRLYPFPVFFGDKKFVGLIHRTLTFAFLTWSTALEPFVWSTVFLQCVRNFSCNFFVNSEEIFAEIFYVWNTTRLGKFFCVYSFDDNLSGPFCCRCFLVLKRYIMQIFFEIVRMRFCWLFKKNFLFLFCKVRKVTFICCWLFLKNFLTVFVKCEK